jgi:glutathione S-transferase
MTQLNLVSHKLCPYVQRAVILLEEKNVHYVRRDIDLSDKPDWFLRVSPLGKTPVLLVDDQSVFESAVICEYLEEVYGPALHPEKALDRARHRSWMEFGSSVLNLIAGFYSADAEEMLQFKADELHIRFLQLEAILERGPFFDGMQFSMVDVAFGPVFRYFDVFEEIDNFGFFENTPKVLAWRTELAKRNSVQNAVDTQYPQWLKQFFLDRRSALSERIRQAA